ncbi:MAG: hypothetical protein KAR17_07630, partial [Cyclobacteriaceae bacterium]|nr:hypothetical protein [Cyclobacteriaceae bacterium]
GLFEIDITDRFGNRPVRISFDNDGNIKAMNGSESITLSSYKSGEWIKFDLKIDATPFGKYSLWINDKAVAIDFKLAEAVKSVERISFRTGAYRDIPNRKTPNENPDPPLPGADEAIAEAVFQIDDFKAKKID